MKKMPLKSDPGVTFSRVNSRVAVSPATTDSSVKLFVTTMPGTFRVSSAGRFVAGMPLTVAMTSLVWTV